MHIPADARVGPTEFPEDEYLLNCPNCDYLLKGLPEARCPECGEPFDRGRLLVQQYIVDPIPSPWRRRSKIIHRSAGLCLIVWAVWTLPMGGRSFLPVNYIMLGYWVLTALSVLMTALAGWSAYRQVPLRRKRQHVKDALMPPMKARGNS